MIDNEVAHHTTRVGHEAGAVWKRLPLATCDVDIGLMKQGGGADSNKAAAFRKFALGHDKEFGVEAAKKGLGGDCISRIGGADQRPDGVLGMFVEQTEIP